jgi:hypothetical protein
MSLLCAQLLKTAKAYLDAHEKRDINALASIYSPTCKHHNFPKPIEPIFPDVGSEGYLVGVANLFKMWHSFECRQFAPPVVDSEARKVVLFIEAKGEADVGTYVNEYIVVLTMNEAGTVIVDRLQFFDSQGLLTWVARMGQQAQDLQDKVKDSKAEMVEA